MAEWNVELFRIINDLGKQYTFMNPIFIGLAEYSLYAFVCLLIVYCVTSQSYHRMMVISAVILVGVAELLGKAAGALYQNMQPFVELTFLWVALACLASISRIGVGVHYPTDVLVGGMIAALSAVFVYLIVHRLHPFQVIPNKCNRMEKQIESTKRRSN